MAYQGKLRDGQTVILENQADQTVIRVTSRGQSQSSSATTGYWKDDPLLFQTEGGAVAQIRVGDASAFYRIQDGQLQSLRGKPVLEGAEQIKLETVPDGTDSSEMKPMQPMKPMKPL